MRHAFGAILCAVGMIAAQPAVAAKPFDGLWTVDVMTERGICPRELTLSVTVENGEIDNPGFKSTGAINNRGGLHLTLEMGSEALIARGSVRGTSGAGSWQNATKQCSGHWKAIRD